MVPSPGQQGKLIWLAVIVLMNCQSGGRVALRSNEPLDPPLIDLNLLSHPYDLQVAIQAIRSTIALLSDSSIIPTEELALGPKGLEDADIEVSRSALPDGHF